MRHFEQTYWRHQLHFPDWYARLENELHHSFFPTVHNDPELKAFRNQAYDLIADMLERDELPLATQGPNLDAQRKPVDTIVIHHTEENPAMRLEKLSAIGLVRQYALQYLANNVLGRPVRSEAIWSGHFRAGRMVFFAYHWLIRPDGTAEHLLEDSAIGWHAGDWDINTRSCAVTLAGNYETTTPPAAQIAAAAEVIRTTYPSVRKERIIGHREVRAGITCPGSAFLDGWKARLLEQL